MGSRAAAGPPPRRWGTGADAPGKRAFGGWRDTAWTHTTSCHSSTFALYEKFQTEKKKSAKPNSAGLLLHSGGQALHSWVASAQASCSHMGPHAQQKPAPHALLPRGRQQLCLPTAVSAHGASPSPVPLCLPQPGLTPHCPSQCQPGAGARKA